MAGPPFQFANHYQVVGHFIGFDTTSTWRTELTVVDNATPQPTDPIILAIRDYFRHNLRDDCKLDHIELRQWSYGPQPLAARGALWESPQQTSGLKVETYGGQSIGADQMGKEVVAFVKLNTTNGKPGKQFIRQLYDGIDIGALAGGPWAVIAGANVTLAKYLADTNALFNPYYGGSAAPGLAVVHFSKKHYDANPVSANLPFSTPVLSMTLVGPTTNRPTRKNKR